MLIATVENTQVTFEKKNNRKLTTTEQESLSF